jgi:glycosyltransferase involved in cell wall biosynthesis
VRLLLVTEKCGPSTEQRDGGARLVETLRRAFEGAIDVLQFDGAGGEEATGTTWRVRYPSRGGDRFHQRLANADFVAARVREALGDHTDVLFAHTSMQFGLCDEPLRGVRTWTFPMFLTPSYLASGEAVPPAYTEAERRTLASADRVITPSHFERRQLIDEYGVPAARVRVVPRGVDRKTLAPRARRLDGAPIFCSVGSIKRQKNTLGLVQLFDAIRRRHPGARLRIVGPEQDAAYARTVRAEIAERGLGAAVELVGYVPPSRLGEALDGAHIHLSASSCETFGRAIFEALASGLPSVAPAYANAAAELLDGAPYARFYSDTEEALQSVDAVLAAYDGLSELTLEIGDLFDDALLGRLLAAEIRRSEALAVSDYDGTLYHKADAAGTRRSMAAFERYPMRVVCSARSVPDLLASLRAEGGSAHYLIGWSGAVVADAEGRTMWCSGFAPSDAARIASELPAGSRTIEIDRTIVQFVVPNAPDLAAPAGARVEVYQGTAFVGPWGTSKLRAVIRLLRRLDWRGRVRAFGDGRYDEELLAYFDGARVGQATTGPSRARRFPEIGDAID